MNGCVQWIQATFINCKHFTKRHTCMSVHVTTKDLIWSFVCLHDAEVRDLWIHTISLCSSWAPKMFVQRWMFQSVNYYFILILHFDNQVSFSQFKKTYSSNL